MTDLVHSNRVEIGRELVELLGPLFVPVEMQATIFWKECMGQRPADSIERIRISVVVSRELDDEICFACGALGCDLQWDMIEPCIERFTYNRCRSCLADLRRMASQRVRQRRSRPLKPG